MDAMSGLRSVSNIEMCISNNKRMYTTLMFRCHKDDARDVVMAKVRTRIRFEHCH